MPSGFPGFAKFVAYPAAGALTVDNGLLTPTLKIRRTVILERYAQAGTGCMRAVLPPESGNNPYPYQSLRVLTILIFTRYN